MDKKGCTMIFKIHQRRMNEESLLACFQCSVELCGKKDVRLKLTVRCRRKNIGRLLVKCLAASTIFLNLYPSGHPHYVNWI